MRILQTMVSGISVMLGLTTRMLDPYVYVVCWARIFGVKVGYKEDPSSVGFFWQAMMAYCQHNDMVDCTNSK